MAFLFAVIVVALIGGIAVVASGVGAPLSPSYDDRPDVTVPAHGPLTSADLAQVRFTTAVRGYRASEVDALLERLGHQLDGYAPAPPSEHVTGEGTVSGFPDPGTLGQ